MFVVQVAADIFNNKVNFELSFPNKPTILEVTRAAESAFSNEIALRRTEGIPPHNFHLAKIKVYDEDRNKWIDLTSEGLLVDYCQLYAFQSENPWHKESQKEIPAAVKPPTSAQRYTGNVNSSAAARGSANGTPPHGVLATYTGGRTAVTQKGESQSGHRPALHANVSGALVPKISAEATQEEKLRVLFAEFDVKGNRVLELDDLKQGFRTFNLDFSSATVEDLFERADTNRDNKVSFSEFERFGRLYPIMVDCLFFRSKAFWDEEHLRREIEAERLAVQQAELIVEQTKRALTEAAQDVDAAKNAVLAAEAELKDRADRLRDLNKDMDNAKRERERALRDKKDCEKELHVVRERDKEARRLAQDAARDAEKLDRRAAALSGEASAAEEKVRQIEKALDEARRAAERAHLAADQSARDAEAGKLRARTVSKDVEEAAREIARAEDAVGAAERSLMAADENARGLESIGRDIAREAEEAAKRRDQNEKTVEDARGRMRGRERQLEEVKVVVLEREHAARQKEEELAEQQKQRELVSQHERVLVEQELRLREQRDSLEERETKLMSEASSFLGNLRQQLGGR